VGGQFSTGTLPSSTIAPPKPEKTRFNRWVIAIVILVIVIMGVLFGLIYQSSVVVSTKNFSYTASASQTSNNFYTLQIANVNGGVTLTPWGQNSFLINGTITARGLGSSPTQVNLIESNTNGTITFQALFPNNAVFLISQTYSLKINVFVPVSVRIGKLVVDNVNGLVQANSLNVTAASFSSENGDIDFSCSSCGGRGFSAQTTNGNVAGTFSSPITNGNYTMLSQNGNVYITVPSSSSFKLTASLVSGTIQTQNLVLSNETKTSTQVTATVGTGSANVILSTVVGQITITGT
jgi:putative adhesin